MRGNYSGDLGKKVTAIELGRIGAQNNCVGIERKDSLRSFPMVRRNLVSSITECRDNLLP
jgi:hypothetical protein